jgi:serine/alanine adding enzyme
MNLRLLTKKTEPLWGEFITKSIDAHFQHTLYFKDAVESTYNNCSGRYYFLEEKGKIKAIFPLFLLKSKFFGNRIISLPFVDDCGFVGEYTKKDLLQLFQKLKNESFKKIELRVSSFFNFTLGMKKLLTEIGFNFDDSKQQVVISLTDVDKMWRGLKKNVRNSITLAERSGLVLKKIDDLRELKSFYKLYFKNMKQFGTPQHSFSYIKNLLNFEKNNFIALNVYHKDRLAGAVIAFFFNNHSYLMFNVSESKLRKYGSNDFLYWNLIKECFKQDIKSLDLGEVDREPVSKRQKGVYNFKIKWLGEVYDKYVFSSSFEENGELKSEDDSLEVSKLKKYRRIWKKMPRFLVRFLGPKLASNLGK